ncbi:MAG: ring-cleaving dioxygenase [Rhodobacteraceae bacterium]|nr:MAG: ring-cleaving dioxygenase [Paracoccaceae bacterium]
MTAIAGLHHVTALCADPQANFDFYTGRMGQRLVKRTVNFDAPDVHHLYYGDRTGAPGTVMTFFPFPDAAPGRAGDGMARAVAYAASPAGFDAAMDRLARGAADFDGPAERFGRRVLALSDPDGLTVEIAETTDGPCDGLHSVTLQLADPAPTARLLIDVMGFVEHGAETGADGERLRLRAPGDARGGVVDLLRVPRPASGRPAIGRSGAGAIHHVAFRARDAAEQRGWRERLRAAGFDVTPVTDRRYFNAIYFREPGGVLFEIATDQPGFTIDEPVETLGQALKLPPVHAPQRARIERVLPPLDTKP